MGSYLYRISLINQRKVNFHLQQDLLYLIQTHTILEYTVTKMMFCIILEYLPTISKVQELTLLQDINLKGNRFMAKMGDMDVY